MKTEIVLKDGGITLKKSGATIVQGGGVEIKNSNKPVSIKIAQIGNIYLLLDVSISMAGSKIEQAKIGALDFAKNAFRKEYAVGLITFGTEATHICEPIMDPIILERCINTTFANGGTNMADAISISMNKLANKNGFKVMVIITDGNPYEKERTLSLANQAKQKGIDIITIGTEDADVSFLKKISSRTDLNVMVSDNKLAYGINSTISMLPQIKKGG